MKTSEDKIKEKISSIEKRVVELKFIERDIKREREIIRLPLLGKAERCGRIEELIQSFFVKTMNLNAKDVTVTSDPSGCSGRNDDEFLSEVKIEMRYRPESQGDYSEISLTVYLTQGFEDKDIRIKETRMMDRLIEVKGEIEQLREEKRELRSSAES